MKLPLRDGVAVVTGAASGIGRATALALSARGSHLALVDRDAAALHATAERVAKAGVAVSMHVLDLTDREALQALPEAVRTAHGRATILFNGAGASLVGRFDQLTLEEFRWLMEVNFFSVVGCTHAFLPLLIREPAAQIVNISSIFGIVAPAEQSAYAASKFAVRGFSESLRHELAGTGVGVTVVHPGGVKTSIATSARVAAAVDRELAAATSARFTELALRLPAEAAAAIIVRGIERRRKRLLVGADARSLDLLQRFAPASYWSLLRRGFERLRVPGE